LSDEKIEYVIGPIGASQITSYGMNVSIADAEGNNPKAVYKTRGKGFRVFMWH